MIFGFGRKRKSGIYLGRYIDDYGRIHGEASYNGTLHLLTIGPSGSSKTAGLVVPAVSGLERSMIILDPKIQIAAITARKRKALGKVIILNPMQLYVDQMPDLKDHGWNVLALLDPNSPLYADRCKAIATILIQSDGNARNSFFFIGARNLVAALIMYTRRRKGPSATLYDVRLALTEPSIKDKKGKPVSGFQRTVLDMATCDYEPIANLVGSLVERMADKQSQNTSVNDTRDTAIGQLNWMDSPAMAQSLAGPAIDWADFRKEITTCFVVVPTGVQSTHAAYLRLVVGLALERLYDPTPLGERDRLPPILMILEEFYQVGYLDAVERALGIARDSRVVLWPFLQDLNQLKQNYPKTWQSFFTGAGTVTTFRPKDWETAEFFSKYCGLKTETTISMTQGVGGLPSINAGRSGFPLFRPEDLRAMPPNRMLCFVEPEARPFFTHVPPYPDTSYGKGLDPNPYYQGR